jgi:hypothetical protein
VTYAADFYCTKCGKRITYQKHKRSGMCDKCLDYRNHKMTRRVAYKVTLPAGFYTLVTDTGIWRGCMIYNAEEVRTALGNDDLPIGGIVEYWCPPMRCGILYDVVPNGKTGLALVMR